MSEMISSISLIKFQSKLVEEYLSTVISAGVPYALVDFPNHQNVGDSAIWLGEIEILTKVVGVKPRYVCDYYKYIDSDLRINHPEGPIFIHGGGNFGDIWPEHQDFRERIIKTFPDRQIIQLPQSISFGNPENAERCAQIIADHGRFTLLVRDKVSEAYAQKHLRCEVRLLPDMAFGIGALRPRGAVAYDGFMLLRSDKERSGFDPAVLAGEPNTRSADWLDEPAGFPDICRMKTRFNSWGRQGQTMETGRFNLYMHLAQGRLERGLKMLSSGRVLITDRLHAHILATLLDKPHVVLDNNYGKIFSYIAAWTHPYQSLRTAATAEEAIDRYRELLSKCR